MIVCEVWNEGVDESNRNEGAANRNNVQESPLSNFDLRDSKKKEDENGQDDNIDDCEDEGMGGMASNGTTRDAKKESN